MNTYQDWLESKEVTLHYEVLGTLPDGSVFQVKRSRVCENEKQANELIDEWNRLSKITKGITWNYRRLQ